MLHVNAKIMLADDSASFRDVLREMLKKMGFIHLIEVTNGVEALDVAQTNTDLGLVILDLRMPKMDGLIFLQELRKLEHHKKTPVLILTADRSRDTLIEAVKYGPINYAFKPLQESEFTKKISELT